MKGAVAGEGILSLISHHEEPIALNLQVKGVASGVLRSLGEILFDVLLGDALAGGIGAGTREKIAEKGRTRFESDRVGIGQIVADNIEPVLRGKQARQGSEKRHRGLSSENAGNRR